jgi:hypothetical protein
MQLGANSGLPYTFSPVRKARRDDGLYDTPGHDLLPALKFCKIDKLLISKQYIPTFSAKNTNRSARITILSISSTYQVIKKNSHNYFKNEKLKAQPPIH